MEITVLTNLKGTNTTEQILPMRMESKMVHKREENLVTYSKTRLTKPIWTLSFSYNKRSSSDTSSFKNKYLT